MKAKHPSKLKVGDRVGNGTAMRGVVTMAAKRGEYVRIAWTSARREDTEQDRLLRFQVTA